MMACGVDRSLERERERTARNTTDAHPVSRMERLANTKPLPIPKRRPHPRPTLRDPHSSTAPWSQEGVAELGGD
jgi:hypothetical protein